MKEPILYRILRPLDKIFIKLYRPTYIGLDNIPKEGSFVLAGNHTSKLDPLLLMSCTKRTINYLGKIELCRTKIQRWFFLNLGLIPVDRSKKNPEVIKKGCEVLNNGGVIGIFPEGTINRTDNIIIPFKFGAVKMAKETDSYIVPFTIKNKFKLLKKSVTIEFDKPYKLKEDIEIENKKLEDKIIKMLKEKN